MPRKIQVNKTTGFRPDTLGAIVARCEKENREWNDVIDEVLRKGLEMDTGDDTQTEGDKEYGRI